MTQHNIPTIVELEEVFDLFDDWEDRYRYLIELGTKLPKMPEHLKTEIHKVDGCTSQVWMVMQDTDGQTIDFLADSDAYIVKGLIAVLFSLFQGVSLQDAAHIDVEGHFQKLGLEKHLSPNRRNGFFAMVGQLRRLSIENEAGFNGLQK